MKANKRRKKILLMFTMLAAVLMMATGVSAAKKPALVGSANRYYFSAKNQKEYNKQPLYYIQKGDKITKIQSTNPKVATVYKGKYAGQSVVMCQAKKLGKTTFKVWVKRGKKVYPLSKTVTFYRHDPFKTVKIGSSRNYASEMNSFHGFQVPDAFPIAAEKLGGKIKIEMNKGWSMYSIVWKQEKYNKNGKKVTSTKKLKNGDKIELLADQGDGESVLTITYRNKKTKEKAKWEVYCYLEEEEDW